jgi:hypothetical protein
VDAAAQLPEDLANSIARCVDAVGDLDRLRDELHALRLSSDPRAQFATALFDLDRARRGDPEARNELIDVADRLLVFWREGSGAEYAALHPGLESLWDSATALLVSFEQKRFKKALAECWERRANASLLQEAIERLEPSGNRRVEFARCLYHLELARQFVDTSRAEFARRAGLLSEAYQSDEVAHELVGDDEGLAHLWHELKPYLDEFFEMMEEEAARRARQQAIAAAEAEIAAQREAVTPPAGVPEFSPRAREKTDPELVVPDEVADEVAALAEAPQVPSFRTLMARSGSGEVPRTATPTQHPIAPPPPPNTTPPGSWFPPPEADVAVESADEVLEVDEAPPPPPAPVDLTPPGAWVPGADGDIDIIEEAAPPPPPRSMTPAQGVKAVRKPLLDIVIDEDDPDAKTIAWWQWATKSLDLLPDPKQPRAFKRLLNVENRADRKKLTEFLEAAEPQLPVPDAKAFSALLRLTLAGQLKEKSLFGQKNARRTEAFAQAFALLSNDPRAAGHGAVWFELDGPDTLASLQRGLDVLAGFLTWCARERRDPLDPAAQTDFLDATD